MKYILATFALLSATSTIGFFSLVQGSEFPTEPTKMINPEKIYETLNTLTESNTVEKFSEGLTDKQKEDNKPMFKTLEEIVQLNKKTLEDAQVIIAPFHKNYLTHLRTHKKGATKPVETLIGEVEESITRYTSQLTEIQIHLNVEYLNFHYADLIKDHKTEIANFQPQLISKINDYLKHIKTEIEKIRASILIGVHSGKHGIADAVEHDLMWHKQAEENLKSLHAALTNGKDITAIVESIKTTFKSASAQEGTLEAIQSQVEKVKSDLDQLEDVQKNVLQTLEHTFHKKEAPTERPKATAVSYTKADLKETKEGGQTKGGDHAKVDEPAKKGVQVKGGK